jgi:hypothetical protein
VRRASVQFAGLAVLLLTAGPAAAQKAPDPEVGYVYPPGAQRGQIVAVQLAGFDWTPDLEFFVLDPRVTLTTEGSLSRHLMPEPPFPVGMRAYRPPSLPREIAARIVLPPDLPAGPVRWQVANANGTSSTGVFIVGDGPEVVEDREGGNPQTLEHLPVTVSGRLARFEEVDRYLIEPVRDGLITCDLVARRLGSNFNGVVEVRDERGLLVADAVDSEGMDVSLTFAARASTRYQIFVRDLNFRGNRACVYRLSISEGPRVLAVVPAAGRRGATGPVELMGYGLGTGRCELERVTRAITFPDVPEQSVFVYRFEAPAGAVADFTFRLSDLPESIEPASGSGSTPALRVPVAVTGALDRERPADRYRLAGRQGEIWNIAVEARRIGSPLDVAVTITGPEGRELAANDDLPGTTDAGLEFSLPADGIYELIVSDLSGSRPSPLNLYRLVVQHPQPDFKLQIPQRLNVPIGDKAELTVKVLRTGGFQAPIALTIAGLPPGISVPAELVIAAGQGELKIPLQSAADAPSGAALVTMTGTAQVGERKLSHVARAQATGNIAPRVPEELAVESFLVASTMKPVTKIRPIETDERTAHRGTVHLAELAIERLQGFEGEVIVQMDSRQPAKFRQGLTGPDAILPPGSNRLFYPCLVPDYAETVDAYRFLLVAVAQVPDSRGRVRYLLSKMQADDASVAITVEGALLKVSSETGGLSVRPGDSFQIPVKVARSAKLPATVRLEVRTPPGLAEAIQAEPLDVPPGRGEALLAVRLGAGLASSGKYTLVVRATALQSGSPALLSDTASVSPMDPELVAILKRGALPVVAETSVALEVNASPSPAK